VAGAETTVGLEVADAGPVVDLLEGEPGAGHELHGCGHERSPILDSWS
jgi:hypothetical protein